MKRFIHTLSGLTIAALMFAPGISGAADINIKVATTVSTKHAWIKVVEVLQAETDKRAPGKVNYEVFLGAQLGKDPVVLAGIQSGTHMMTMQASSPASIIPRIHPVRRAVHVQQPGAGEANHCRRAGRHQGRGAREGHHHHRNRGARIPPDQQQRASHREAGRPRGSEAAHPPTTRSASPSSSTSVRTRRRCRSPRSTWRFARA